MMRCSLLVLPALFMIFLQCTKPVKPPAHQLKEDLPDESHEVNVTLESSASRPQQVKSPPLPKVATFAGDTIPLDREDVREALEREVTINTFLHSKTMNCIRQFQRWRPLIEQTLEANQIPRDFIYLAVAESELSNTARSPDGAMGMWQFMEGTAKDYDLRIDRFVDMRRDPELSTEAACKYFVKSYTKVNDWVLVAASFNRGPNGISEALEDQKVDNFFDLHLNEETSRYIYRILALKLILENPQTYGYYLDPKESYTPYQFETVEVKEDIDLVEFARSHGVTYKELRLLNPWFNNTSNYKLNIPWKETYELRLPVKQPETP